MGSKHTRRTSQPLALLPEPPVGLSLLAAFKLRRRRGRGREGERFPRRGERKGRHVVSKIMAPTPRSPTPSRARSGHQQVSRSSTVTPAQGLAPPSRLILTLLLSGACLGLPALFISDATRQPSKCHGQARERKPAARGQLCRCASFGATGGAWSR